MSKHSDRGPRRSGVLFTGLFGAGKTTAFEQLSAGIEACLVNAVDLLADAGVLGDARRFHVADFLAATAREEMAKAYILLDMSRVDFGKRHDDLRRLCSAFYNHVSKHTYFELSDRRFALPGMQNLRELQAAFEVAEREWWPGTEFEPDMPHDTYFEREANLYVDLGSSGAG